MTKAQIKRRVSIEMNALKEKKRIKDASDRIYNKQLGIVESWLQKLRRRSVSPYSAHVAKEGDYVIYRDYFIGEVSNNDPAPILVVGVNNHTVILVQDMSAPEGNTTAGYNELFKIDDMSAFPEPKTKPEDIKFVDARKLE